MGQNETIVPSKIKVYKQHAKNYVVITCGTFADVDVIYYPII